MNPHSPYLAGIAAFVVSLLATPLVRWAARKRGWVARPRKDRWHTQTTALMGGIAIFSGLAIAILVTYGVTPFYDTVMASDGKLFSPPLAVVIFSGSAVLFLIGLIDDFVNLRPQTKLIGQIVVASAVTFLGFRLNWFHSLTLDTMVSLVWIVGITNAFNLLDNMDGLCAGVALVCAMSMALMFSALNPDAFGLAIVLAGACAGFLVYNFNPASIFMGDCGSLVIGYSAAVLAMQYGSAGPGNRVSAVAVPLLLLIVPLLDTSLVTIIRLLSGRKASTGGRDHTSHRLVLMGFSEKSAVLMLYGIGAISGISAIIVSRSDTFTSPVVILPVLGSVLLMGIYLSQLRVYPEKEFSVLRNRRFTPVLIELTYRRQLAMIVMDLGLVAFAYYLSYRLRFGGRDFSIYFQVFLKSLPLIIACKLLVFHLFGVYKGFWRYLSTGDVFLYIRSSVVATVLAIASATVLYRFEDFSKGVFTIDWLLTTLFLLGTRGSFRLFTETMKRKTLSGDRVIIYGAGQGGELLLREILNNKGLNLNPVGFLDDDPLKTGKKIQGYPIFGRFETLPNLVEKHGICGILLSFNGKTSQDACQTAIRYCRQNGLYIRKFAIQLEPIDLAERKP